MSRRPASLRVLVHPIARAVLLAVLALEGWGTLLVLATLYHAVARGPRAALGLLRPSPESSGWAWLAAFSAALAFVTWVGLAAMIALARRPRRGDPAPAQGPPADSPESVPAPDTSATDRDRG